MRARFERTGSARLGLLFAAGTLSCSAANLDHVACDSRQACATTFGLGWVCGAQGFCEATVPPARCTDTYPEDLFFEPSPGVNRIVFGSIVDRSLATHRARERAIRLALAQANGAGGLELREFGGVFCTVEKDADFDGLERREAAVAASRYLVDALGVPAIIGPAASDDVDAVVTALRATDDDTLVISPSATSPTLAALDPAVVSDEAPGLLWRTAPPDSLQGAAIAFDMRANRDTPVSEVAVVFQTGTYGEALTEVFVEEFRTLGGSLPALYSYETDGQRAEAIGAVAQEPSQEVLFVSSQTQDVIDFMNAAATLPGFDPPRGIFLTDAAANVDLLRDADPARFPQVRGTRQAPRDDARDLVYAAFLAAYTTEYGEDARQFSFTANAYDAAWLLAYGAAWSVTDLGAVTGPGIARGLRHVSAGESVELRPSSWNNVKQAFSEGRSIDVEGASGSLDFDPISEEPGGTIETWRINEDHAIEGVARWPPSP